MVTVSLLGTAAFLCVLFGMPPVIRLTAFGCTRWTLLKDIETPLAISLASLGPSGSELYPCRAAEMRVSRSVQNGVFHSSKEPISIQYLLSSFSFPSLDSCFDGLLFWCGVG